ncbi:hypothetical protein EDF85_1444 [Pseudomonas putida]|uniref:Uncharacterized protein n=1 Tax=Pseudomonas putida TaxID=303 RepID=A0A9X8EKK3_PSEPU|nr:hypothetical protein EDF85_1444 [Pseudomonas putida]
MNNRSRIILKLVSLLCTLVSYSIKLFLSLHGS